MKLDDDFPWGRFAPPATEQSISQAESALGVQLPFQLREFYLQCDGFRENRGNAQYLLPLIEEDASSALVSLTTFMWQEIPEFVRPDLSSFLFFGMSGGGETWGINWRNPTQIIAYHHHMEDEFEVVGEDIIEVWKADFESYDEVEGFK